MFRRLAALGGISILIVSLGIAAKPKASAKVKKARPDQIAHVREELKEKEREERAEKEARSRRKSADRLPFDSPQEAQSFFMERRGATSDTYSGKIQQAISAANQMPIFSTATNAIVPNAVGQLAAAWSPIGPGNVGGRSRALIISPSTPTNMLTAGIAGGVWKSTNGGASWSPKSDLLANIGISTMALDPRDPNIVYAGTGEGFLNIDAVRGQGIYKSNDFGETWNLLNTTTGSDFFFVTKIVATKGSSQRIYATTSTGIFRSIDGGTNWTKVFDATAIRGCMDVAVQTDRALAYVVAACGSFTQSKVVRALDTAAATQTWTSVLSPTNMGRTSLAIAPSNQSVIYALASQFTDHQVLGVYRSTNGGATWTTQFDRTQNNVNSTMNKLLLTNPVIANLAACGFGTSSTSAQGWYDNIIAVDPVDSNRVWTGGIELFRSDDGGQNFGEASFWWFTPGVDPEYAHADNHAIVFHPQYDGVTNKTMFVGNDGGIFSTSDARAAVSYSPTPITNASPVCGNTDTANIVHWNNQNSGYQVTQFYDGAVYPDGNTFFGGTQDNGTPRGTTGGGSNAWTLIKGGDGGYVAVNPANTDIIFAENTALTLTRSVNGSAGTPTFSAFTSGITDPSGNFLFIAPFTLDPSNPQYLWTGGARMWRSSQANANPTVGNIFVQASQFFGVRVSAIAVAPSNSDRVYAGTGTGSASLNGTVFTTASATTSTSGTTWTSSKPRADSNYVSWLAVHPTNPAIVWATVSTFNSGTGTGHVFKSTDSGATWTNIDGTGVTGIPDVPVHCIVVNPANVNSLYVGTDIGVFVSQDGGATWARENTGFANVSTYMLTINNNALYAFTHGRSAWKVQLQ